jgi:hypothetical protein
MVTVTENQTMEVEQVGFKLVPSLSATGITKYSAWVNLGNVNHTGIKYQQE